MQREDVERVKAEALNREDEYGEAWVLASDYAELLDRAERAEAAHDKLAEHLAKALSIIGRLEPRAEKAEAERDAAFAAGQEEMRERAAEAVLYLGRMKEMGGRGVEGPEVAHLIRALPIKPRPE